MFSNIVEYEAQMDNWQDMQEVMNEITSGSPAVDDGSWQEAQAQVEFEQLDTHVKLVDTPHCVECGKLFDVFTAPGYAEKGVCSGRCWQSLYGEFD